MKKISKNMFKGVVFVVVLLTLLLMGCQKEDLTITFNIDGGNIMPSQVVKYEDKVERPEDPIKKGYGFQYWEKDGKEYDFNNPVTKSFELKAIWEIANLIFDKQEGSGGTNAVNATYGSTMPKATAPTRTDYVFLGYYDDIEGGTKYYNQDMSSVKDWDKEGDVILYARWMAYDSILYFRKTLNGYTISAKFALNNITELIIPSEYKGQSVTGIGNHAFYNCYTLTNITIPDSITTIGQYAFSSCVSLTNITIPDSITTIGQYAFSNCVSLTNITIPDSITIIGQYAFSSCVSLTSVIIPNSVTIIENFAFHNCYSLIIYCKASSKPYDWGQIWNVYNRPVVWGYTNE